ncbi:hypothetical protein AZKH_2417 [Azoarcus sp. KH32C]|nr:hypothetical protein AZKH_2417 [Azoarcus sp. KH32C]
MDAIADLQKGEGFLLLLDRMPHPLLRLLDRDGYRHESRVQDDGSVEVRIDYP